jgi:SAM-dependent methyltransferase
VSSVALVARRAVEDPARRAWLRRIAAGDARRGWCPICARSTVFVAMGPWLRDDLRCLRCWSIPRQRALIRTLERVVPDWRARRIHESSPDGPSSDLLARECPGYDASQLWPDVPLGALRDGVRCEDLGRLTFADAPLDVVVTQDVLEHLLEPERAFREVARVLRPGGVHVLTVPLGFFPTVVRARLGPDGEVEHLQPPDFHRNPVDPEGSLVATEWGVDLVDLIERVAGTPTEVHGGVDRRLGIEGWHLDVLVSRRPA